MLTQVAVRTTPEGNFRVTVNQKILVHLLEFVRFQEKPEVPRELTQQGIAEVVNARRSHVSLALSTLKERGLVEERTTRVIDEVRRKKAYSLTSKGYEMSKKLVGDFMSRMVRVEDSKGVKEVRIENLQEVVGDKYYLVDVLCCINREGTLDVAALTGQEAEQPPPPEPKEAEAPVAGSEEPSGMPMTTAPQARETRRARAFCPACQGTVEFPYEDEGPMTVICGYCGSTFRSAVGTPTFEDVESVDRPETYNVGQRPLVQDKSKAGFNVLVTAMFLSWTASVLMFLAPISSLFCLANIAAIPFVIIALGFIKDQEASVMLIISLVCLILVIPLLTMIWSGLIASSLQFIATSLLIATVVHLRAKPRTKLASGAAFAAAAALLPFIQWWTVLVGVGLLIGAGVLFGLSIPKLDRKSSSDRDAMAVYGIITGLSIVTYLHWVFFPRWDWWAIGRAWLLCATLYAFVLFAKPIAPKLRSEVTVVVGVFLMSLASCIAIGPWLIDWGADVAAYTLVLAAGSVYLANKVHKIEGTWPLACLGIGLFIVMYSVLTLALSWGTISVQWRAALVLWAAAGFALCAARFAPEVVMHLASLRAGVISAMGAAMVLAGLYMLIIGLRIEGAVETVLGVPLLGYALFKSGAPWRSRLIISSLFVTTVALTWFALVTAL